jgi:hypothetical protein
MLLGAHLGQKAWASYPGALTPLAWLAAVCMSMGADAWSVGEPAGGAGRRGGPGAAVRNAQSVFLGHSMLFGGERQNIRCGD